MLSLVVTAIPSLTANECFGSFLALDPRLNLPSFDLYESWFDDNSIMTLAQAGSYKGAVDIEEYVRFVFPSSPNIAALGRFRADTSFVSFDAEKRSCVMMSEQHARFQLSEMAGNELFEFVAMYTLEWRFDEQKVGNFNVYYDPSFLAHFFSALSTPAADKFVCQTMRDSCADVWAANELTSLDECEAKLAALPLAEGDEQHVDGNTCATSTRTQPLSLLPFHSLSRHCVGTTTGPLEVLRGARAQVIVPQAPCGLRRQK